MPLFNIFSSKNKKVSKSKKPQIVADIHEKNSLVLANLTGLGADIHLMPLKIGDYLINNTIIERKTFSDFISSMLSKRLIEQLNNMQQYKQKLLILEGELDKNILVNSKLNPNSLKGMILSTCLDLNIPVIQTKNEEETSLYMFLLAKRQLKSQTEPTLHSRIPKTKRERQKYILESFQNIGPKTAEKLMKEFKTIRNIFNSSEENLNKIIGKKASVFKIIDENY